ncbi:unnamed protein product [Arabis nemorensis]|uniref:TF-B3 domain-containing protein n=1 Tax=Arabis nemorensis TaxID=586526 RepID=A0A565C9T1_9BRAS|nr:unnamed protein product [Arabis nemorensis]
MAETGFLTRKPRFFLVFVSHFSSTSLKIPSSYYDELPHGLSNTVTLEGTGGCSWKIVVMKKPDGVYFGKGWSKFVEDNQLKDGDSLMFLYDGDRIFEVSIYGEDGCKEVRAAVEVIEIEEDSVCSLTITDTNNSSEQSENKGKSKVDDSDEESDPENPSSDSSYSPDDIDIDTDMEDFITALTEQQMKNSGKREFSGKSKSVKNVDSASCSKAKKAKKLVPKIKNPEKYLKNPSNPYFETSLKNRHYELLIHAQLVKDYNLKFEQTIEYIDGFEKLKGNSVQWGDRMCIKNWNQICERNHLKEEDRILCELFRKQNVVYAIQLHIVRGKDL